MFKFFIILSIIILFIIILLLSMIFFFIEIFKKKKVIKIHLIILLLIIIISIFAVYKTSLLSIEEILTVVIKEQYRIPYHTYNNISDLRLTVDMALPKMISSQINNKMLGRMFTKMQKYYLNEITLAKNGVLNYDDIVKYLNKVGILNELNISYNDSLKAISDIDTKYTYYNPVPKKIVIHDIPIIEKHSPEFGEIGAVFVTWPLYNRFLWKPHTKLIKKIINAGSKAYILVNNEICHKAVLFYIQNIDHDFLNAAFLDNIKFIYIESDHFWARDYTPEIVKDINGRYIFIRADFNYISTPIAPNDQKIGKLTGDYLGVPTYYIPIEIDGGNILSDGNGTIFMNEAIYEKNTSLTKNEFEKLVKKYYGAKRLVILPKVRGELAGHIDPLIKIINENTIIVADTKYYKNMKKDLDKLACILGNLKSHNGSGKPYNIIRLPVPIKTAKDLLGITQYSYSNSLLVNKTLIMPLYNDGIQDKNTMEIYKKALPADYKVVGIDFSYYLDGSIHCATKEIPVGLLQQIEK